MTRPMARALLIAMSGALSMLVPPAHAPATETETSLFDAHSVSTTHPSLPVDFPLISRDGKYVAIVRNTGERNVGLVVDLIAVSSGKVANSIELLSASESKRPLLAEVQHTLAQRLGQLNTVVTPHAFRPMPLLYKTQWQRDLAFSETLENGIYRVILQQPGGSLRITSSRAPGSALELTQPSLPITLAADCLQQSIPIEGWFDTHANIVVLRRTRVPPETCNKADEWVIETLP